jgi:hypothetical protein
MRKMRLRLRSRGDSQVPVHCGNHSIDLAVLKRLVSDGLSDDPAGTAKAIAAGECPACRPRYTAGYEAGKAAAGDAGAAAGTGETPGQTGAETAGEGAAGVECACCGTSWQLGADDWSATAGAGLRSTSKRKQLAAGDRINGKSVIIDPFDPIDGPVQALESGISAGASSAGLEAPEGLEHELAEAMWESACGRLNEDSELERIESQYEVPPADADRWRSLAMAMMKEAKAFLGESE